MKTIFAILILLSTSLSQLSNWDDFNETPSRIDSIVNSAVYETAYIIVGSYLLQKASKNEAGVLRTLSLSSFAYAMIVGVNSVYFKVGDIKTGLFKSLKKTAYLSATAVSSFYLLGGKGQSSISNTVLTVMGTSLAVSYVYYLVSKSEIEDFRKKYDAGSYISFEPLYNPDRKTAMLSFTYHF